jgi:glycosyltransferase involved in cell wall biosynthesis
VRTKDRNLLLQRAIQSIMNQSFTNWEILLINNGGDKVNLEEVLVHYQVLLSEKLKIIHLDNPQNMETATNIGIINSEGKFITLLDDDDTWEYSYLEECVSVLDNNHVDGVVTRSVLIYEKIENNKIVQISTKMFNPNLKSVQKFKLARRNLFTTNAFMYKRSVIEDVGLYREDFPVLGDWEFNIRFSIKYKIVVIPKQLANYHKRLSNETTYGNTQISDHLNYDRIIRVEYLSKGINGEISLFFALLTYLYFYLNQLIRFVKKAKVTI